MQPDRQTMLEDIRRLRVFYEIFPERTPQAYDAPRSWFEIALHVEVKEHRPPEHPNSREAFFVLMGLADLLIQRVQAHAPYQLDMSALYNTLHPPPSGDFTQPRLAWTISLVFPDVAPYTHLEPDILAQLRAELILLGIPRLGNPSGGGCQ
jgi:hypothetical protein